MLRWATSHYVNYLTYKENLCYTVNESGHIRNIMNDSADKLSWWAVDFDGLKLAQQARMRREQQPESVIAYFRHLEQMEADELNGLPTERNPLAGGARTALKFRKRNRRPQFLVER